MKRLRLISFITLFLFFFATPVNCFAEWISYTGPSPNVELIEYINSEAVKLDREVMEAESTYLAQGIKETKEIAMESGMQQHVDYTCEVDLKNNDLEMIINTPEAEKGHKFGLETVEQQVEDVESTTGKNIIMGLNTDMFIMKTGEPTGLIIVDGEIRHEVTGPTSWSDKVTVYHSFFAITEDGEPVIESGLDLCYDKETDTYNPLTEHNYQLAVSGDIIILKNEIVGDGSLVFANSPGKNNDRLKRHPRVAVGIKDDGSLVFFCSAVRIAPINYGYTDQQVAMIMKEKGCHTAMMLDGGGSSTYVSQHSNDKDDVVRNLICDIGQRNVATSLMIAAKTKPDNSVLTKCEKKGHNYLYKNEKITCENCKFKSDKTNFSGLVKDVKTGRYRMFVKGKTKTGFTPYGFDEVYYFNKNGLSCNVKVLEDVETTCTMTGYKKVFCKVAPAGKQEYKLNYESAPGHDFNKKSVCINCGLKQYDINDCEIKLSKKKISYTGKSRTPSVTVITPKGAELTLKNKDFNMSVKNNVDIGKATLTIEPIEYSTNYLEDRCSITGTRKVKYQIVPAAATGLKATSVDFKKMNLKWTASKTAKQGYDISYDVYQKINGKWKLIGNTKKTTYTVKGLKKATAYDLRICAATVDEKGNKYASSVYAEKKLWTKGLIAPVIKASKDKKTGKVKLTWKKVKGADKYKVYRAKAKNGKYYFMKTVKGTSYINKTAVKGKNYWYKVKAIDADDSASNSVFSNIVKGKCK